MPLPGLPLTPLAATANYRRTPPKITWTNGAGAQTIYVRYSLGDVSTYPEQRPGALVVRFPGDDDAWSDGEEYYLEATVQWIPAETNGVVETGWNGAAGWSAFLRQCWLGNAFNFYPNAADASVVWPCELDMPRESVDAPAAESDYTRALRVRLRRVDALPFSGY